MSATAGTGPMKGVIDRRVDIDGARLRLLKLAVLLLRNDEWAEDAVEQALRTATGKGNDATAGSDLVGILKESIADRLRRGQCDVGADARGEGADTETIDGLFGADGRRAAPVFDWGDPGIASSSREFAAALEACVGELPTTLAQVLLLREWMRFDAEAVCRTLGIAEAECRSRLLRARLLLGDQMQRRWPARRAG